MRKLDTSWESSESNAIMALSTLLEGLKAKVTRMTVQDSLSRHPAFPSLLSLSETLTDWSIDNSALQLDDASKLQELPIPFIAHLHKWNGWFVVITDIKEDKITYYDSAVGLQYEPLEAFKAKWSGVVLLAETNESSGEENYLTNYHKQNRENLKIPVLSTISVLIALASTLMLGEYFSIIDWILAITKLAGLTLSGLLVMKQLGLQNAFAERLCRINDKTSCDTLLNSPASKLWGWLSWADVGLLYFTGSLLMLIVSANQPAVGTLLSWLSLLVLPYTIFSVYYQARVAKQWCPLCLGVQVVLMIEGSIAFIRVQSLPTAWQPYSTAVIALLLPVIAWILIRPLLANITESRRQHHELMKLKRNPDLFRALLVQQPSLPLMPADLYPVILGNLDGEHTITLVTNPFCTPCARVHKELSHLLHHNPEIKVHVIFSSDGPDGLIMKVAAHIMALDVRQQEAALTDWYRQEKKDYQVWAGKHTLRRELTDYMSQAERHGLWCHTVGIKTTPTLFINSNLLSDFYKLEDIRWLISELEPA